MSAPDSVLRWASVVNKCKHPEVAADLVLAMIWQETETGDRWAYRYENRYQYFYDRHRRLPLCDKNKSVEENRRFALQILGPTEFHAQSASYGLMQVMGAVGRERGFKAPYLTELCDPELSIKYGTLHLWIYGYAQGKYDTAQALARYNGQMIYSLEVSEKLAQL